MPVRVGINGLGRIGRSLWRVARGRVDLDVVAVNDVADIDILAHLLRRDSIRGRLAEPVEIGAGRLTVGSQGFAVYQVEQPASIPWGQSGVDVVLDATGRFFSAVELRGHLRAGARRVVVSSAAPDPDATLVFGVNHTDFDPARHRVVSPGCCTTNAVAPVLAVLRGLGTPRTVQLTTIHAYDSTHSALWDGPHRSSRTGRSATTNLVPSRIRDTVRAITAAQPWLTDRVEGIAVRVPLAVGCLADLVVELDRPVPTAVVNAALRAAAAGELRGLLGYTEEPLVSSDIVGLPYSGLVDGLLTTTVGAGVKVMSWYDNEWGYANRLADLLGLVGAAD